SSKHNSNSTGTERGRISSSLQAKSAMASATKTARRLLLLLQIALFVSAAIMSGGSVCHGAQEGFGGLRPGRPACIGERCPIRPGYGPYGPRPGIPYPRTGGGGIPYPRTTPAQSNGEIPRP
ncbi:unnamed protein product, partial [Urochloa humidicola]